MKRLIALVFAVLLLMLQTVFAGDIPESLLHSDDAQIFFAEVIAYHPDKEIPDIEISPVKKIKGDVKTGTKQIFQKPNTVGDFKIKTGDVYLFTYFDENNYTDIFEVTSYDTKTLKLKNVSGDMWERFEKYLNDGEFEEAEQKRIDRQNEDTVKTGEKVSLSEYAGADRIYTKSSVSIYSGPDAVEVERDKFFEIADEIMLEKIEPEYLKNGDGHDIIISLPENMQAVYITSAGRVSKQNETTSLILPNEYIIKAEDMAKISDLFESERNLPPIKKINVVAVAVIAVVLVFAVGFVSGYIIIKRRKGEKK